MTENSKHDSVSVPITASATVEPMRRLPSYKEDLKVAYDADVARRKAMTPTKWRTDIVDRLAEDIRSRGAEMVLDLGCGTGQLAKHLADQGFDVTAIDPSLPFPDNSFDASFAMNSLLHVPPEELSGVLFEISRVLVRGATLLIVVWGGSTRQGFIDDEWLDPPRYFSTYTDDDLVALETPGFRHGNFRAVDIAEDGHDLHLQILTLEAI